MALEKYMKLLELELAYGVEIRALLNWMINNYLYIIHKPDKNIDSGEMPSNILLGTEI